MVSRQELSSGAVSPPLSRVFTLPCAFENAVLASDLRSFPRSGRGPRKRSASLEPIREPVSSVLKRRVVKPSEQRRAEILEAALSLFSSKGFHETTMEEVAHAAGVAKGTIYLYFPSKEHVLLALKREFMQGLTTAVADIVAEAIEQLEVGKDIDYRDIIDDIFDAVVDYHTKRREAVEVVVRQSPSPDLMREAIELEREYLALISSAFRTGAEYGLVHTEDPDMTAHLVTAA